MAEHTYEDVVSALRAADAAGDNEGASRLAQIAASMQAQEPAKETASVGDQLKTGAGKVLRTGIEAGSFLPNSIGDFIAGAHNVGANVVGSDSRWKTATQWQGEQLDKMGLPRPEGTGEEMAYGGLQALTSAAPVNAVAKGIKAGVGMLVDTVPKAVATVMGGAASPPVAKKVAEVTGYDALGMLAGAATGAVVGGASGKGAAKLSRESPYLSIQEIRDAASAAYKTVDDSGLNIKRSTVNTMLGNIQQELANERFDPRLNPKVATTMDILNEISNNRSQPLSLSKLDDLRKRAGDLRASSDKNDQRLGRVIINGIDEQISALTPQDFYTGATTSPDAAIKALLEARTMTRNRARAEVLDAAMTKAEVKSELPGASEGELLRRAFNNIEADPKKFNQFNDQEKNVIKAINRGGALDKGLSFLARFNPERRTLEGIGTTGTFLGAAATGSPKVSAGAAALAATGFGADKLQGVLRSSAAQNAVDQISNGRFIKPQDYSAQGLFGGTVSSDDAMELQRFLGK